MDRPDETSGLSAAPAFALPAEDPHWETQTPTALAVLEPPRPLPARAFMHAPETAAALNGASASHAIEHTAPEPLSADAAFAVIDADASARSRSAVETALAAALNEIKPHAPPDIREIALPIPTSASGPDLGQTVPRRMFEPRLEIAPATPAFDPLRIEPPAAPEPHPLTEETPRLSRDYWSLARRIAKFIAWAVIGWLALVLALIFAYRFVNPPASMLMLQNWLTGGTVSHTWVPFDEISPNVVRAVLLSEDGRFCQHSGVDLEAIEEAIENSDGRSRGGSTISMQVIKNLFLWPSKSYLRKAIELPLTFVMELVWPKRRIMEVYLNIAEWGPGVFGIGAAAAYHFGKTARELSVRDASRLAASLPNPLARNAGRPGPGLQRLANAIQVRMRLAPSAELACVLPKRRF